MTHSSLHPPTGRPQAGASPSPPSSVHHHLTNAANYRRLTEAPGAVEFPTVDGHVIILTPVSMVALSAELDPCGFAAPQQHKSPTQRHHAAAATPKHWAHRGGSFAGVSGVLQMAQTAPQLVMSHSTPQHVPRPHSAAVRPIATSSPAHDEALKIVPLPGLQQPDYTSPPLSKIGFSEVKTVKHDSRDARKVTVILQPNRAGTLPSYSRLPLRRAPRKRFLAIAFPSVDVALDFHAAVQGFLVPYADRNWHPRPYGDDEEAEEETQSPGGFHRPQLLGSTGVTPSPSRNATPRVSRPVSARNTTRADAWTHHCNVALIRDALVGSESDLKVHFAAATAPPKGATYDPFINALRNGANDVRGRKVHLRLDAVASFTEAVFHELLRAIVDRGMRLASVYLRDCPQLGESVYETLAEYAAQQCSMTAFSSVGDRHAAVEPLVQTIDTQVRHNALAGPR